LPQSQRLAPTPGLAASQEQIAQLHVASTVLPPKWLLTAPGCKTGCGLRI
jgi:hypothetical protein